MKSQVIGKENLADPSLFEIYQTICEEVILPFGIKLNQDGPKTVLFYGPKGNGKTLMADTIVNETHSILLDISPFNIANLFQDKQSVTRILYKVFRVAREFQPSVILFEESEHFFGKKNLKKLKNYASKCQRFKKDIIQQIQKHLLPTDQILIIGISDHPEYVNVQEAQKFFKQKFYFPFPNYNTRLGFIQKVLKQQLKDFKAIQKEKENKIEKEVQNDKEKIAVKEIQPVQNKEIFIGEKFDLLSLAYNSEGFSLGTLKEVIKQVLIHE